MGKSSSRIELNAAKNAKNDEFYTQLCDIENELKHYLEHFKNKVIYCNCDDPEWSNFYKYFKMNFEVLGLKKLISTHFEPNGKASYAIIREAGKKYKIEPPKIPLKNDGDFRSEECIEFLKEADIVVTNPPFSLFREYVTQLIEYKKQFLIIGNVNSITYKKIFKLIKNNQLWLGISISSGDREFRVPASYPLTASGSRIGNNGEKYIKVKGVRWYTNLDNKKRNEEMILWNTYNPEKMPKYDNYDSINVDKTSGIPVDYDGVIGVPITFLDKYNPNQFEIIGLGNSRTNFEPNKKYIGCIKHMTNGKTASGEVANSVLILKTKIKPKTTYYTLPNDDDYLIAPYARVLIQKKRGK